MIVLVTFVHISAHSQNTMAATTPTTPTTPIIKIDHHTVRHSDNKILLHLQHSSHPNNDANLLVWLPDKLLKEAGGRDALEQYAQENPDIAERLVNIFFLMLFFQLFPPFVNTVFSIVNFILPNLRSTHCTQKKHYLDKDTNNATGNQQATRKSPRIAAVRESHQKDAQITRRQLIDGCSSEYQYRVAFPNIGAAYND